MSDLRVVQILGENVSYQAKGAFIRSRLVEAGLADAGLVRKEDALRDPQTLDGAVVVLADAYHLHEDPALVAALQNSVVLAAPSVLRLEEARHAKSIGVTLLAPQPKTDECDALIADGTIRIVSKIPAAPLSDAFETLMTEPNGAEAADDMFHVTENYTDSTLIYPPGSFSAEAGGKHQLTQADVNDLITTISEVRTSSTLVICGGRVNAEVVGALKQRFGQRENIAILSQNDYKADLPSVYTILAGMANRKPHHVLIDGLARTTLEVVALSAGLRGEDGLTLMTSESMVGNKKREGQIAEYYTTYDGKSLVCLGKPWTASLDYTAPSSGPELDVALAQWLSDKRLVSATPNGAPQKPATVECKR